MFLTKVATISNPSTPTIPTPSYAYDLSVNLPPRPTYSSQPVTSLYSPFTQQYLQQPWAFPYSPITQAQSATPMPTYSYFTSTAFPANWELQKVSSTSPQ